MASYAEQLGQWRQQRRQAEAQDRMQEIAREHREHAAARDQALADNDLDTAAYEDDQCQYLEKDYAQYVPQQPQTPRGLITWAQQNPQFFERHGERAARAVMDTVGYMMRAKTNSQDPRLTGMGMARHKVFTQAGDLTPEAQQILESGLEMHGPRYWNVNYSPDEKLPTWQEAANFSGAAGATRREKEQSYIDAYNKAKILGKVS